MGPCKLAFNPGLIGEGRLPDEPRECLRGRLGQVKCLCSVFAISYMCNLYFRPFASYIESFVTTISK